jgi:serine/threonine protein kinase
MTPVRPLPPKTALEEYVVLNVLGQGGFGTTYLSEDTNLSRKCVLKEFTPHHLVERRRDGTIAAQRFLLRGPFRKELQGFLDEARKLARFNHPNIVRINRFFEANGTGYFVMDYESGRPLRSILANAGGQFEEAEIEAIVLPLCEGLDRLHSQGLLHRDIKPDNILIRSDGSPVLLDFGAACSLDGGGDEQVIVTPRYAPIEQYAPQIPKGPWIDLYALAATMYEMISGRPPQPSIERIKGDRLVPAREIGRGRYGDRLLGLIDKGLAVDYKERPQDVKEFIALLRIDNERYLREIVSGLTDKTLQHFLNWAKPNRNLYADEFIAFVFSFIIVDLSWRLGHGTPTKAVYVAIYRALGPEALARAQDMFQKAGFQSLKRNLTLKTIEGRIDEYAATYLLDRQAEMWTYDHTRRQCARNSLSLDGEGDKEAFVALLENVIDRCRGRVKKEFEKAFRNVEWIQSPGGWRKEIRRFE